MEEHNLFAPRAGYDGNKSLYAPQELTAHGTNQPIESHTWTDLAIPDDPESGAGSDARLSHYDVEIKRVNLDRKDADHSISLEELRRFCNGETPETNQVQHCINALNTIFNHQQWNNCESFLPSRK